MWPPWRPGHAARAVQAGRYGRRSGVPGADSGDERGRPWRGILVRNRGMPVLPATPRRSPGASAPPSLPTPPSSPCAPPPLHPEPASGGKYRKVDRIRDLMMLAGTRRGRVGDGRRAQTGRDSQGGIRERSPAAGRSLGRPAKETKETKEKGNIPAGYPDASRLTGGGQESALECHSRRPTHPDSRADQRILAPPASGKRRKPAKLAKKRGSGAMVTTWRRADQPGGSPRRGPQGGLRGGRAGQGG